MITFFFQLCDILVAEFLVFVACGHQCINFKCIRREECWNLFVIPVFKGFKFRVIKFKVVMIKCGCQKGLGNLRDKKWNVLLVFYHFACLLEFFVVFQVCCVKWTSDKDWMNVNTEHCDFSGSGYRWLVKKVELFHLLELSNLTVVTPAAFTLNTWYNGHNLTLLAIQFACQSCAS